MEFPETHNLATLLTGNACLMEKRSLEYQVSKVISEFVEVCVARFNGNFKLNLCIAQVFKTKNSE